MRSPLSIFVWNKKRTLWAKGRSGAGLGQTLHLLFIKGDLVVELIQAFLQLRHLPEGFLAARAQQFQPTGDGFVSLHVPADEFADLADLHAGGLEAGDQIQPGKVVLGENAVAVVTASHEGQQSLLVIKAQRVHAHADVLGRLTDRIGLHPHVLSLVAKNTIFIINPGAHSKASGFYKNRIKFLLL